MVAPSGSAVRSLWGRCLDCPSIFAVTDYQERVPKGSI
jgi:hypothetical protein